MPEADDGLSPQPLLRHDMLQVVNNSGNDDEGGSRCSGDATGRMESRGGRVRTLSGLSLISILYFSVVSPPDTMKPPFQCREIILVATL